MRFLAWPFRLPPLRTRLRTLLALVAVVALGLSADRMRRARAVHRDFAAVNAELAANLIQRAEVDEREAVNERRMAESYRWKARHTEDPTLRQVWTRLADDHREAAARRDASAGVIRGFAAQADRRRLRHVVAASLFWLPVPPE